MFSKILVTLAVVMACIWVLSNRAHSNRTESGRTHSNRANSGLREIPNPVVEKRKKLMRLASYGFMVLMVLAAAVMIYLELRSDARF